MFFKYISYASLALGLSANAFATHNIVNVTNENLDPPHHITRGWNGRIEITEGVLSDCANRLHFITNAEDLESVKEKMDRLYTLYPDERFFEALAIANPEVGEKLLHWTNVYPKEKTFSLSPDSLNLSQGHVRLQFQGLITDSDGRQTLVSSGVHSFDEPYCNAGDIIGKLCEKNRVQKLPEENGMISNSEFIKITTERKRVLKDEIVREQYYNKRTKKYESRNKKIKVYNPATRINEWKDKTKTTYEWVNVLDEEIIQLPAKLSLAIYQDTEPEHYSLEDTIDILKLHERFGDNKILIDIRYR